MNLALSQAENGSIILAIPGQNTLTTVRVMPDGWVPKPGEIKLTEVVLDVTWILS